MAKIKYLQEPLFEEFKKDICYVCYQRIKGDDGLYIGKGMWRHKKKCKPGGNQWLKSPVAQDSTLKDFFERTKAK